MRRRPPPRCAAPAVPWLLWRQDLQNYFRSMTGRRSRGARCRAARRDFGEICEALAEWLPEEEIPLRAASLLGTWADSGIIDCTSLELRAGSPSSPSISLRSKGIGGPP